MKKLALVSIAVLSLFAAQSVFAVARVAILHLAPFASDIEDTAVDIVVNGNVLLPGVKYKDFVGYQELQPGIYVIDIVPVGATEPALSETFTLSDGLDYSVFAIGNGTTQPLKLSFSHRTVCGRSRGDRSFNSHCRRVNCQRTGWCPVRS